MFHINKETLEKAKLISESANGELNSSTIVMDKVEIVMKEHKIFLDHHIIEASDHAKFMVLDTERKLIKKQVKKHYGKKFTELEANILAYQDLLMTKEMHIRDLNKKLNDCILSGKNQEKEQIKLLNIKITSLVEQIERLKNGDEADRCPDDHDSDDELTHGQCNKNRLRRRVYKKIDQLHKYIESEVKPEIHARYTEQITDLMREHHKETDAIKEDYEKKLLDLSVQMERKIGLMEV